ncbi:MAG: UDP-N-acetylmuramate dehydrogenase [Flavobacteriaceae bacterium]|nr:UDP-N-acetylmuramate dehydrogenase [Flavobacteriaceae bacterium]
MKIIENLSLKSYHTFGGEASAKYFASLSTEEELTELLQTEYAKLPLLILGGGSNVFFTQDFKGLVIQLNLKGIQEETLNEEEVLVSAKAGENWHEFVQFTLNQNYGGLENLSLIPGNVGASPVQNIGAYGVEIKDVFHSCKVVDLKDNSVKLFKKEECQFGYRDSIFKQKKGQFIILEVSFKLTKKNHKIKTEYGAIKSELQKMNIENPTIQEVSQAVINIRQAKLPDPKEIGNGGSFFKNPTVLVSEYENLKQKFPEIPSYKTEKGMKIPAAWLIESCDWKGKQIGNVATHHLQALVIINATGKAHGKEIWEFSEQIIQSVKEKFGIVLEREINVF